MSVDLEALAMELEDARGIGYADAKVLIAELRALPDRAGCAARNSGPHHVR